MSPRSLADQQNVSQESHRQPKYVPGASQTSKMCPRLLPDSQNVSQKPPRPPKCLPGAFPTGKMCPRSLPDSQNVSQELPRQAKCLPKDPQTAKMFPRSLPHKQDASQEPSSQSICLPGASQTDKITLWTPFWPANCASFPLKNLDTCNCPLKVDSDHFGSNFGQLFALHFHLKTSVGNCQSKASLEYLCNEI